MNLSILKKKKTDSSPLTEEIWREKYRAAVDLYHEQQFEQSLEMFTELSQSAFNVLDDIDSQIWIATCLHRLDRVPEARAVLDTVTDEYVELNGSSRSRAFYLSASIYVSEGMFDRAFSIYKQLVEEENSYEELSYLDMLIDDAARSYDYYQRHGTVSQWKSKLLDTVDSVLKKIQEDKERLIVVVRDDLPV